MTSSAKIQTQTSSAARTGFRLRFYHVSVLLVVAGLLVTGYMSYAKLAEQPLVCAQAGIIDCSKVESSAWAYIMGIPTAIWGFGAHLFIGLLLLLEVRVGFFKEYTPMLVFGAALFGLLYHVYLTYVSVALIGAVCPWCLTAASIMIGQFIITIARLRHAMTAA